MPDCRHGLLTMIERTYAGPAEKYAVHCSLCGAWMACGPDQVGALTRATDARAGMLADRREREAGDADAR